MILIPGLLGIFNLGRGLGAGVEVMRGEVHREVGWGGGMHCVVGMGCTRY